MGYWCHFKARFRTPEPIAHIVKSLPEDWLWATRLDIYRDNEECLNVVGDIEDLSVGKLELWFDIAVKQHDILKCAELDGHDEFYHIYKTYKGYDLDRHEIESVWKEG